MEPASNETQLVAESKEITTLELANKIIIC
jgi:hypothetical protein